MTYRPTEKLSWVEVAPGASWLANYAGSVFFIKRDGGADMLTYIANRYEFSIDGVAKRHTATLEEAKAVAEMFCGD